MTHTHSSPTRPAPADPGQVLAQQQIRILGRLAEMAMEQAEAMHAEIMDPPPAKATGATPDQTQARIVAAGIAFPRLSRLVVQIVALQSRIARELYGPQQKAAAARAEAAVQARQQQRRRQVERIVDQAITQVEPEFHGGRKLRDMLAKMLPEIDPVLDPEVLDRPLAETVARLCRQLGIAPDWSRWAEEDWAIAEARDQPPGSPYAKARSAGSDTG
ncbi:hypothetical protein E9232_002707 [Inquilinus ginsengisoli]|uniref:Uncharacterized protein n=1 Tax=Inquilinus ginsengisoli TaxID=363840 RepID=A0ABU1JNJ4_9PROT|nr:hypothetical protein [Inquilinus ginsengisoli]MDR6290186.1 hypothetical protein [Inquilinus ginsengisoli]